MKKIVCLLLALCMLCVFAMAETAPVFEFGDFTLSLPEGGTLTQKEKTDGGLLFQMNYMNPSAISISCKWTQAEDAHRTLPLEDSATEILVGLDAEAVQNGFTLDSSKVIRAEEIELDGRLCRSYLFHEQVSMMILIQNMRMNLYTGQMIFSDPETGAYTFTIAATTEEDVNKTVEWMKTIVWNVEDSEI